MGQAIAERIPGAVFKVIEGASHLSVLETPEEFRELMEGFLRTPA
jgi:3-oxoadipate enol-lactonase